MTDPSIVRFRALIEAGLAALEARREEVNDLNVFPVADGDTGDNMVLTLRSVLHELDRLVDVSADGTFDDIGRDEIVSSVARAALLGARGNSGVILSQLIRGAAEELVSRPGELIDATLIGAALANAADRAYSSVREPAEGTILTVAREMAQGARRQTESDYALSVTGIAGPAGGTDAKPVGTVFVALADPSSIVVERHFNPYDRETFKQVTAQQALELLRRTILAAGT